MSGDPSIYLELRVVDQCISVSAISSPGGLVSGVSAYAVALNADTLSADDVFKSTRHRAVNRSGVERHSIPLFFGTDYNVLLDVRSIVSTEGICR